LKGDIEMDGRSGWLRALAILVLVVIIGGIGYTMGVANAGTAVATGAAPVVYAPWGFGFGFFGLLFPILFIGLLLFAFGGRGRGRGGWGHGGYGPRGYGPDGRPWGDGQDVPPRFEPMLESWHRRAHGDTEPGQGGGTPPRSGS
jgi:hypothetical protein